MKRAFVILAVLAVLLTSMVPYLPKVEASLSSGTLADAMNAIITANSWSPTSVEASVAQSGSAAHYANVFSVAGSSSYYQIAAQNDQVGPYPWFVLQDKDLADLDGMSNAVSDATLQNYLSTASMTGYLPITYLGGYFLIYHRFEVGAYQWANDKTKWNAAGAMAEITSAVSTSGASLAYSTAGGYLPGTRYYDEPAETLEWMLAMGGLSSSPSTCSQLWQAMQNNWNGQMYCYHPGDGIKETEVGPFALVSGLYMKMTGDTSYISRIVSDLNQKLLAAGYGPNVGNGGSPYLWNHYSLNHIPAYDERRLDNAASAWAAMEAYYSQMTPAMQTTLQGMGAVGWGGLLDQSGDFHAGSNKFSFAPTSTENMGETGVGLMILFMNGIIPQSGSLAIPLNERLYQDASSWSPATMFNFNYNARTIKIPVNAGTIGFRFGSATPSANFASTGVYTVQFSNDWNSVVSVTRVGSLDSRFQYILGSGPPPPDTGTLALTATYNGNSVAASVHIVGPTSTTVTTPINLTVGTGDYSLTATYDPGTGTQTIPKTATVSKGLTTSVNFPFVAVQLGTLTIKCKYDSVLVVVAVQVNGPNGWHNSGSTTLNDQAPLTYSGLQPGSYQVVGNYANKTLNPSYIVTASPTPTDAVLDFGSPNPPPFEIPTWAVPLVGVSAGGIIALGVVGSHRGRGAGRAYPPRRKRRPHISHPRVHIAFFWWWT